MSAKLEKETKETYKSPRSNRELFDYSTFFLSFFVAICIAAMVFCATCASKANLTPFVEDFAYNNKNIVKHVATGFADQTLAFTGVILGTFFVVFAIAAVCSYLDKSKKLLKVYLVLTILSGLSTAVIGSMWWPAKYTQAQDYNNSPAASCLKVDNDVDYIDGQCVVSYNINVVDSIFAYSEKKEVVQEINGKYVKGTEYTVAESGKSYGNTHKPHDKVFISDEELVNREKELQVGDSAFTDYEAYRHLDSDSSYSNGNALGDDKKYVMHFTREEHKVNVLDHVAPPGISSIGSKISIAGSDYTYINIASDSCPICANAMVIVRSDALSK